MIGFTLVVYQNIQHSLLNQMVKRIFLHLFKLHLFCTKPFTSIRNRF